MTEDEARQWLRDHYGVPRETLLASFVEMLIEEAARQNLIASATLPLIWLRHVVDSAQLIELLAPLPTHGAWIDIGTGAGFPGMIIALLTDISPVILVEPRRKRAEFLGRCASALGIGDRVRIEPRRVEQVGLATRTSVISARAVASLPDLLAAAHHLADEETIWLLPKGINALEEVEAARRTWHGMFHVEPSITQPGSLIVVATGVSPR